MMVDLSVIKTALLTVTDDVFHFIAPQNQKGAYIVWAEDGQADSSHADDRMVEQVITGTIDYYTKSENDSNFDAIQDALNEAEISFDLSSIQYEEDTKYIHYEWIFEVE